MKPKSSEPRHLQPTLVSGWLSGWSRWLANYGLSLSAADYVVPGPGDRESRCPFAALLAEPQPGRTR